MAKQGSGHKNWLWLLLLVIIVVGYHIYPRQNTSIPTPAVKGISTAVSSYGSIFEVYFTDPQFPFDGVYTGGIEQYLIEKINNAKSSIDVAVYQFDLESVVQALINAKNRGVDVRVVYDNDYADPAKISELENAGIKAIPDDRSAFMHNKFFVFDDQCLWTGSFNITENAAYKNDENALYFCSDDAAENYTTEFSEMFAGQFGPSSSANTPYPIFTVDGINIENYFAPEDDVMDKVVAAVATAKSSIQFMAYEFTDNSLGQALEQKFADGLSVEGIFESSQANSQYSQCAPLLKKGISVYLDGNPAVFHHKVMIIDDSIVITGSFNFTQQANKENDENLLIIHDPGLAATYEKEYQLMKSQAAKPTSDTCKK